VPIFFLFFIIGFVIENFREKGTWKALIQFLMFSTIISIAQLRY